MFHTTMKDDMDGMNYPPVDHETEFEARAYATKRTGEERCEMQVLNEFGETLDTYRLGEVCPK